MKVVVTGSLGKISRPLAQILVKAGHQVTVVSSKKEKTTEIQALGANAAIGSVEDVAFLPAHLPAPTQYIPWFRPILRQKICGDTSAE